MCDNTTTELIRSLARRMDLLDLLLETSPVRPAAVCKKMEDLIRQANIARSQLQLLGSYSMETETAQQGISKGQVFVAAAAAFRLDHAEISPK